MSTGGDLDQLGEAVSDLRFWESAEKREVEECVHWGMIGAQTVLVVAIVDSNLD